MLLLRKGYGNICKTYMEAALSLEGQVLMELNFILKLSGYISHFSKAPLIIPQKFAEKRQLTTNYNNY